MTSQVCVCLSGNKGSRAGMGAKGSPVQMIDDVGTISTFVANDDEVTTMISTLMERVMNDPEVSKALVRLVITVLDGNPSTQCVLDKLPLSPADLRMLFDVFVGSNGQAMMKTVAGLVSDLTTGPDTKAFLESALGMASMFKRYTNIPNRLLPTTRAMRTEYCLIHTFCEQM